jgi:formate dehydrogenase maturation protein FdhE
MPLDRIPDRYGRVRALVTAEECARLLDLGYQIRLHRHHPIEPIDARLITTDESVQRWLDEILAAARPEAPAKSRKTRKTS